MAVKMKHDMKLIEESDRWLIPIQGLIVTQCRIDYAFSIVLWESREFSFSIRIGGEFICRVNNQEHHLHAERAPMELSPAISVLHKPIETAVAKKDGFLELMFTSDIHIIVPPDPKYEAWELSGSKGLLMVCTAGGNVSLWQPR